MRIIERLIEQMILASRWLLVPVYLALSATLMLFGIKAVQETIHLFEKILVLTEVEIILAVLSLIDLTLIANLLVMVILSGYETFVSTLDLEEGQEKPAWLGKVDAGTLKIKVAVAIVAISSIHLLRSFMHLGSGEEKEIFWLVVVHLTFVVSALLVAIIDKIAFNGNRH